MEETKPSVVRLRALAEYASLESTVQQLKVLAQRLRTEGVAVAEEALRCGAVLLAELSKYVELEDLLVLPSLRNADVWGEIRATALSAEHEARRDELTALSKLHKWPLDTSLLADDFETFACALATSLARERKDVLESEVLRDDVVQTEAD